ncbi:cytochrome ubiquinol oxidase subunit I [Macrococcus equipercicus]|uniref:Cytochrome ubiquinol oxidase subunit I n=1 Tax=Macrococcus equipercicus TaxID=69967 RepID=A0A9Q9BRS9_9STAP|nr:cytochrome ubiquinol oxidase subunit I [Macrococcus equipercicus]KAA1042655.1 cytochrome ubiquinol oxidase subunit I [Macrococcus equipercicus]UTH14521.1 cytochrome ubiquinol oxidase subunit I [Macrococcus equipercicus]
MDAVVLSRLLTAMTLAFHIIFATIGVALPVMFMIAEGLGLYKKDPRHIAMAKRWAKGFTITVAVGVVTGTIIGLLLSLLWPTFMKLGGQVIALPLFMETFAFFFEAIFLSIYLYTWDRFKNKWLHWLINFPIIIGSTMSALFITSVNSFMNTPQGFKIVHGKMTGVDPIAAMLNPSFFVRAFHVVATGGMTIAFMLASIAAVKILRNKFPQDRDYHTHGLKITITVGLLFGLLTIIAGDMSAKFLHNEQPEKLAAMEWHFKTERQADLVLFGILDPKTQEVKGAVKVPGVLSFLADNNFNTKVTGLDDIPKDERPPLIIHYFFDLMVFFGMFAFTISIVYLVLRKFKPAITEHPFMLYMIALTGPMCMLSIEFGWFLAEMGRQPWLLRGYLKVVQGATQADGLSLVLVAFAMLYAILGFSCAYVLIRMFRDKPAEFDVKQNQAFVGGE